MCQLTYINMPDDVFLKLATDIFAIINTMIEHKNGFGICQNDTIFKTEIPPIDFDLSKITFNSNTPIILHVRRASAAFRKLLTPEFNHPFLEKEIILAHNGTLETDKKLPFSLENLIDSQIFLKDLSNTEGEDIPNRLITTMKDYTGKFAFLIRDLKQNKDYAAIGKTAVLHKCNIFIEGNVVGYIINTELESFKVAKKVLETAIHPYIPNISFSTIFPLEAESIYLLGELETPFVGTIKENKKEVWTSFISRGTFGKEPDNISESYATDLLNLMTKINLTIAEVEELFLIFFGTSMLEGTEKDFADFIGVLDSAERNFLTEKKKKLWAQKKEIPAHKIYTETSLNFPYFMNTNQEIIQAIKAYKAGETK